jgi:addiction module HigA family antidote
MPMRSLQQRKRRRSALGRRLIAALNDALAHSRGELTLPSYTVATRSGRGRNKRKAGRCPTHPGALLREDVIPATGRSKTEIAQLLGISRQHLYDILRERKPVSPAVAVRLGKLFGDGAGIWVRMQAAYDTWQAERKEDVSKIPTLRPRAA